MRANSNGRDASRWPHAQTRVVATWRPEATLFDEVARLHNACRTSWLPIVYEYPAIRVGPLVVPGEGPCSRCYARRRVQHDRNAVGTAALNASLAADPRRGVTGFTDAQARIAAALGVELLNRYRAGRVQPGRTTFYNVLTRNLVTDTVTAVHGCRECDRSVHIDDGWQHLAADLSPESDGSD
ncbi:TOMM precursor leader peptide-binding protein [Streptomyces sp. NPDC019539]|uniref:TOMM precursor leader peptide-binding protein n=1 Tax=Streptomyces sp. NPDC019539 TaxID=3365063 RepID=UPI0037B2C962